MLGLEALITGCWFIASDHFPARSRSAVNDGSLSVATGEVIVVCGPSGSGKSTLIKTLNGLEAINSEDIIVDGVSVTDKSTNLDKLRSRIGRVFQNLELFSHMHVTDNT